LCYLLVRPLIVDFVIKPWVLIYTSGTIRTLLEPFCTQAVQVYMHASVICIESLLTWYLINSLWEFHQVYNFGAVWTEMNRLDFEVRRLKVRVIASPNVVR